MGDNAVSPPSAGATSKRPHRAHPERIPATSFPKAVRRSVKSEVRMVPGVIKVDGRYLRFAVSDNERTVGPDGVGSPPVWAINIHGYFAGGGMYWRESSRLADALGWRVITPSLPGFGGSDSLPWGQVTMEALAEQVTEIADHVGAGPAVILGHSMGGAVAIQYAATHPERTLGLIYRDGIATPAWRDRHGVFPTLLAPVAPDAAAFGDLMFSLLIDGPDLLVGRMTSTLRSVLPDARRNLRTIGRTLPVASMLMDIDLRPEVAAVAERGDVPILPVWGVFDRVVNHATAREFEQLTGTKVQWVPGGHSWMLGRPQGQAEVLRYLDAGLAFLEDVEARWRVLHRRPAGAADRVRPKAGAKAKTKAGSRSGKRPLRNVS
jgi:pimeloyl-ACP methyl ester carboxylesterase